VSVETSAEFANEFELKNPLIPLGRGGPSINLKMGASASIGTGWSFGDSYESGQESEQTIGFVLHDDDIGDNIATRVYEDPLWGTPLFSLNPAA
jgi:hypothetical protein